MWRGPAIVAYCAGLGLLTLAGCEVAPPEEPDPAPTTTSPTPSDPAEAGAPSPRSQRLAQYYARVEAELLGQGLLRSDGGGPDTPYDADDLARNFEQIAFHDEYARGRGLQRSGGGPTELRKWTGPVRVGIEFGASVPRAQRRADRRTVSDYTARLADITGHPITMGNGRTNFHVLIMGEDDRDRAVARIREIVPEINRSSLRLIEALPRSIHCLVMAFPGEENGSSYRRAIAFIRAEHPDLLRRSCVHEELAQGLGLPNDTPRARPSIFNDDDEFALLTRHDEALLRLLYSPDLEPGMTLDDARPVVRRLLDERDVTG